jgi:phosphohistidine phosphatase SixA
MQSREYGQVAKKRKVSGMLEVDLVLVSPLRRTLQTATGLFPEHPNIVALEDLREVVMESCNLRRDTEALRSW